ncbi:MAG: DUF805 domain-containing protein [Selenomonadaceae bacterium]|nr:DUF805 domain-containing protein [Selenomonadaceae bacterium]
MLCPKCGAQLANNAKYCYSCGDVISNPQDTYVADTTVRDMFLKSSGRLNRLRYFKRSVVVGIFKVLMMLILLIMLKLFNVDLDDLDLFHIVIVVYIVFTVFFYFLYVRRLQDLNKNNTLAIIRTVSGLVLLFLTATQDETTVLSLIVSLITLYIDLYLLFADGTHGRNDYGADPLGRV